MPTFEPAKIARPTVWIDFTMPFPEIPLNDVVDLTISADEEEPEERGLGSILSNVFGRQSLDHGQPPKPRSHGSPSSLAMATTGSTPTNPSVKHDRTPSKSTRFSQLPPRDAYASTSAAPTSAPAQPFTLTSAGYQTPKTTTPKKSDWSVDKIASELESYATEVPKVHARVVHYTLQEIFKKAPKPRHLSSIDDFADMPSVAVEPGESTSNTMSVKFKVSTAPYPYGRNHAGLSSRVGARELTLQTSNTIRGRTTESLAVYTSPLSASSQTRTACPSIGSTTSK